MYNIKQISIYCLLSFLLSLIITTFYIKKLNKQIEDNPNSSQEQQSEINDIELKIKFLKDRLEGYYDIFEHNMSYDPSTKTIYMFDLSKWE